MSGGDNYDQLDFLHQNRQTHPVIIVQFLQLQQRFHRKKESSQPTTLNDHEKIGECGAISNTVIGYGVLRKYSDGAADAISKPNY